MGNGNVQPLSASQVTDFVNREIDRHLDMWKHFDQGVLLIGSPFVALMAAFVPAVAVLSTTFDNPRRFYLASIPLLLLLAAGGTLVATRYMRGLELAYVCLLRADLMRRFFIDQEPALERYVCCSTASGDIGTYVDGLPAQRRGRAFAYLVISLCSCMAGTAIGLSVWGIDESAPTWLLVGSGVVGVVMGFIGELAYLGHRQRVNADFVARLTGLEAGAIRRILGAAQLTR